MSEVRLMLFVSFMFVSLCLCEGSYVSRKNVTRSQGLSRKTRYLWNSLKSVEKEF